MGKRVILLWIFQKIDVRAVLFRTTIAKQQYEHRFCDHYVMGPHPACSWHHTIHTHTKSPLHTYWVISNLLKISNTTNQFGGETADIIHEVATRNNDSNTKTSNFKFIPFLELRYSTQVEFWYSTGHYLVSVIIHTYHTETICDKIMLPCFSLPPLFLFLCLSKNEEGYSK